jgi:hypothetical protein
MAGFVLAAPALTAPLPAHSYTFMNIVDSSGSFKDFDNPSINSGGTVAFYGILDSGETGIFASSGGPVTTIADSTGAFSGFGSAPRINAAGVVACNADFDAGGEGIFTGSGGSVTTIVDSSGRFEDFGGPEINAAGTVAFRGFPDAGVGGVFTVSSGTLTTIFDANGPSGSVAPTVSINDAGTVAFIRLLENGRNGILTGNGGPTTLVIDTSGVFETRTGLRLTMPGWLAFRVLSTGKTALTLSAAASSQRRATAKDSLWG